MSLCVRDDIFISQQFWLTLYGDLYYVCTIKVYFYIKLLNSNYIAWTCNFCKPSMSVVENSYRNIVIGPKIDFGRLGRQLNSHT